MPTIIVTDATRTIQPTKDMRLKWQRHTVLRKLLSPTPPHSVQEKPELLGVWERHLEHLREGKTDEELRVELAAVEKWCEELMGHCSHEQVIMRPASIDSKGGKFKKGDILAICCYCAKIVPESKLP